MKNDIELRTFRPEDLDAFTALYNSAESENPDYRELGPEDIRRIELNDPLYDARGHFVAIADGEMVASARGIISPAHVKVRGPIAYLNIYVHPGHLGKEVERRIFDMMVERLRERGTETLSTRVDTRHESKVRMLERLGFGKSDYRNHGMEQPTRKMEEPEPPAGYRIRNARVPEELETMLGVVNEAYSTRDKFPVQTLKEFTRSWVFDDEENYSGFFFAERTRDGKVVGSVLSGINKRYNEQRGIRRGGTYSLSVIPSDRKRGLGTTLLLRSLKWIGDNGMDKAYISVNVANPGALNIYKAAGYRTVQVYQGYSLDIVGKH